MEQASEDKFSSSRWKSFMLKRKNWNSKKPKFFTKGGFCIISGASAQLKVFQSFLQVILPFQCYLPPSCLMFCSWEEVQGIYMEKVSGNVSFYNQHYHVAGCVSHFSAKAALLTRCHLNKQCCWATCSVWGCELTAHTTRLEKGTQTPQSQQGAADSTAYLFKINTVKNSLVWVLSAPTEQQTHLESFSSETDRDPSSLFKSLPFMNTSLAFNSDSSCASDSAEITLCAVSKQSSASPLMSWSKSTPFSFPERCGEGGRREN